MAGIGGFIAQSLVYGKQPTAVRFAACGENPLSFMSGDLAGATARSTRRNPYYQILSGLLALTLQTMNVTSFVWVSQSAETIKFCFKIQGRLF
jgi:hypothetical protein